MTLQARVLFQAIAIASLTIAPILLLVSVFGFIDARTLSLAAFAAAGVACIAAIAYLFVENRPINRRDI